MGGFSGKAGTVVGYNLNGQDLMRALPRPSTKKPTDKTINNRGKIKLLTSFLSNMHDFLMMTFRPEARGTVNNWYNLAIKYNNPQAIKGTFPNLEIDYGKVVLSKGTLEQPVNPKAERTADGVKFSWDVSKLDQNSKDQVMLMIYFPHNHYSLSETGGARRSEGSDTVEVHQEILNNKMELYISFVSNDREEFSNSLYIGSIEALPEEATPEKKIVEKAIEKADKKGLSKTQLSPETIAHRKALDIAKNFKALGTLSDIDIANATGLTVEEVETCN